LIWEAVGNMPIGIQLTINQVKYNYYSVSVSGAAGVCEEVLEFSIEEDLSCKAIIGGYVYEDVIEPNCQLEDRLVLLMIPH